MGKAKLEMVTLRFFPNIFNKSNTDSVVTVTIPNQKEKDKGSAGHEGFPELIRTCCISAGSVSNALRVVDSPCTRSPRQSLAALAPWEVFHKLNLCGVTQLQNGL